MYCVLIVYIAVVAVKIILVVNQLTNSQLNPSLNQSMNQIVKKTSQMIQNHPPP